MERRIGSVPVDITWENFAKKFAKFFRISDPVKNTAKLKEEYERLTGRKPEEVGKAKGFKPEVGKANSRRNGAQNASTGKGSRKGSDNPEHGSTLRGKGFEGKESSEV